LNLTFTQSPKFDVNRNAKTPQSSRFPLGISKVGFQLRGNPADFHSESRRLISLAAQSSGFPLGISKLDLGGGATPRFSLGISKVDLGGGAIKRISTRNVNRADFHLKVDFSGGAIQRR
jgi:hypothetical protein